MSGQPNNPYKRPDLFTWGQLAWLDPKVQNEKLHCNPPPGYYPPKEPVNNMAALASMKRHPDDDVEARRLLDGFELLNGTDDEGGEDES